MKLKEILKTSLIASLVVAGSISLAACRADSNGVTSSGPNGDGTGPVDNGDGSFPNTGGTGGDDVGGVVTEDGEDVAGGDSGNYFLCTESANVSYGATTEIGANGLIGAALNPLLDALGANAVSDLLASVADKDLAIDNDLGTASTFTLPVALLGGLISSLDQVIFLPQTQPAGSYAVFAVEFPSGLLELSLLKSVSVTTYLNDTEQESVTFNQVALDLLSLTLIGDKHIFLGMKATKPYDRATIRLSTQLLSVDLGHAMKVHELCTNGEIVSPSTP